ncbi:hypothetical protein [Thermicanus aegyptius]|uniref:hypothetical protein n=1 Tax=Thermicanus aegyptius TaxID=94009 RepID=UPI00048A6F40|nr:hypothetical protein [Thermicanus aegyptius]
MLVIYTKRMDGMLELMAIDDNLSQPSQELLNELRTYWGDTPVYYYVEAATSQKDLNEAVGFEMLDDGSGGKLHIYKRISIHADKLQIKADGVDMATITAMVDDPNSTEVINFYVNGTLVSSENAVNGVGTIQINATQTGEIVIEAESTTKYGRNTITIEAVIV